MLDTGVCNIASYLPCWARESPYQAAVVVPHGRTVDGKVTYAHYTTRQLDEECDGLAHGLRAIGINTGTRTVLMVKPGLEFFALTFALFKVGAVPVFVDPGMGVRSLGRCLEEAEPEAFIGITKAQAARQLLGWGKKSLRQLVTLGPRLFWGGHTIDQVRRLGCNKGQYAVTDCDPDALAAILFTSGSTGPPKGAVYSHAIFMAQAEMLRDTFGIQPGEIDLCTFPLFALFAPGLAMTAIVPEMDATRPAQVDPTKIIDAVEDFGVTNLFGSPALLNRVGLHGTTHGVKLPSLRRVISAGAPVSAAIIDRFQQLLAPGVEIFTPYGATESLPVASIGSEEILGETRHRTAKGAGVCVGRPVAGMNVRILQITDEPIAALTPDLECAVGEIGEITVQGPVVTRAYYNRPQATALAKIGDPTGNAIFHRMGDLGYLDEKRRLWFCGRKSQRVRTDQRTLFTIPCEGVFNAHPAVYRTALVGIGPSGKATPALCVELKPEHQAADRAKVQAELLALGAAHPHTVSIRKILFHPAFPVDIRHNSKIFREKLALWAARQMS